MQKLCGLKQAVVDFEITPNRPDCLAMVGMAREASATFKKPFTYPDTAIQKENGKGETKDYVSVEIKNPESCKTLCGTVSVTDVKGGAVSVVAAEETDVCRHASDQQHRRYNKLCYAGIWSADPRI